MADIEVKYTVKEMIAEIRNDVKEIKTNQITDRQEIKTLKENSIGMWVDKNRIRATLVIILISLLLIQETRNYALALVPSILSTYIGG